MTNRISIPIIDSDYAVISKVIVFQERYRDYWRDQPESYWLDRLHQEVSELHLALNGQHEDPPELELQEIASIGINWLLMRALRESAVPKTQSTTILSVDDLLDRLPLEADFSSESRYNVPHNKQYQARIVIRKPQLHVFVARGETRLEAAQQAWDGYQGWLSHQPEENGQ